MAEDGSSAEMSERPGADQRTPGVRPPIKLRDAWVPGGPRSGRSSTAYKTKRRECQRSADGVSEPGAPVVDHSAADGGKDAGHDEGRYEQAKAETFSLGQIAKEPAKARHVHTPAQEPQQLAKNGARDPHDDCGADDNA